MLNAFDLFAALPHSVGLNDLHKNQVCIEQAALLIAHFK